jgi:hypothetical protein
MDRRLDGQPVRCACTASVSHSPVRRMGARRLLVVVRGSGGKIRQRENVISVPWAGAYLNRAGDAERQRVGFANSAGIVESACLQGRSILRTLRVPPTAAKPALAFIHVQFGRGYPDLLRLAITVSMIPYRFASSAVMK